MSDIILPIFPVGTAAATLTTTVWVGVLVVVWGNLRFGWTMSGLVVPGYLVPLLLIRPVSVAVILIESVVTYLMVFLLSESCRNSPYWCSLFGRDRFFGLVLVSVMVRVICDAYLLPVMGQSINDYFGIHFNYQDQLHSVGLVIVALIANYFWKPGFWRGSAPLATTIGITFVLVRYVLVPYTTFDVANLRYVYEDIASSLLSSPKAYVLLLTTAYIASHMNLRFSWEYNGILIPALCALLWCQPLKIVSSFVETMVILCLSVLVLKLPLLRRVNIQGGRKVALFFTVAFLYRLSLVWLSHSLLPYKPTDLHGFGYLLSTLLANRFHEKGHVFRASVATVKVSLMGAVLGSLIGFGLLYVPFPRSADAVAEVSAAVPLHPDTTLMEALRADKLGLYESRSGPPTMRLSTRDVARFRQIVARLLRTSGAQGGALASERAHAVHVADRDLEELGFAAVLLEDRYAYLRETTLCSNRGLFVFDLQRPDGLLVGVPSPMREPYTLESGLCLFRDLNAVALAVSGVRPVGMQESIADGHRALFEAVHEVVGKRRTLQVRGYTQQSASTFSTGGLTATEMVDRGPTSLWISGALPHGYDLQKLTQLAGELDLHWEDAPGQNSVRELTRPGFTELYLSRQARTMLISRLVAPAAVSEEVVFPQSGSLLAWLLDQKETIAEAGSEAYVPATQEQLILMDQEVLQPLLRIVREGQSDPVQRARRLRIINASAGVLGYVVVPFVDARSGRRYLILRERQPKRRHWGTYLFAEHYQRPFIWQVPRPVVEMNGLEFGSDSFVRTGSMALLLAGAHLHANRDGSADVLRFSNKLTLFNLVHQALLRERDGLPCLVIQSRAIKDPVEYDVVVASDEGVFTEHQLTPLKEEFLRCVRHGGVHLGFVDGSPELAGYELGYTAQWTAAHHFAGLEFVTAWLSPTLRWQYRQQTDNDMLLAGMTALGIPTHELDLPTYLDELAKEVADQPGSSWPAGETGDDAAGAATDPRLLDALIAYLSRRDLVQLQQLQSEKVGFEHVIDLTSRQAFLLATPPGSPWPITLNLAELRDEGPVISEIREMDAAAVRRFIQSRATVLLWQGRSP